MIELKIYIISIYLTNLLKFINIIINSNSDIFIIINTSFFHINIMI